MSRDFKLGSNSVSKSRPSVTYGNNLLLCVFLNFWLLHAIWTLVFQNGFITVLEEKLYMVTESVICWFIALVFVVLGIVSSLPAYVGCKNVSVQVERCGLVVAY